MEQSVVPVVRSRQNIPIRAAVMDEPSVLIVVAVLQGRNFHLLVDGTGSSEAAGPPDLIFQARFLDEELLSDPIALTSADPPACTELGWEVTRRGLHQFRVERKPIKLQAFVVDSISQEKRLIGYWIFDIRSAQESPDPKFEWKPLLNAKFRGNSKQRPEILCALQLIKSDAGDAVADDSLLESPKSLSSISDPSLLENDIQVREDDGQFRIWDSRLSCERDCKQLYRLSVHMTYVTALQKLLSSDNNNGDTRSLFFHFQFRLFGKIFKTSGFDCNPIRRRISHDAERMDILLAVESAHAIRTYFQLYPSIEVSLYQSDRFLASATVPLTEVFAKHSFESIAGEFRLRRSDELDTSEPHPTVCVTTTVDPISIQENGMHIREESNGTCLRQFCFSMDIRSIRSITLSRGSFFVRYLYATFGSLEKVVTSAVEIESAGETCTFHDGYCAFNFASTCDKLAQTFAEVPLLLELMEKDAASPLTAICKLDLRKVNECEEDMERKKLLVMKPHFVDPNGENVAQLTVICCLRDMGSAGMNASPLMHLNAPCEKDSDVFEQLYVTAAVEVEVWKQQQKQKFQKKLLQSMKSHGKTNSLELELRDCLERVKKREAELEEKKQQMDKLEEEYLLRTQKLGDEISQAVLQVQVMYETRIQKERQAIRLLEEQNKQMTAELASMKPKLRPAMRTQSLARVNSVSIPVRSTSRSRAASVTSDVSKPPLRDTRPKSLINTTPVMRQPSKARPANGLLADRKTCVLDDLKNERETLLRNGLCRSDDPMIKTIESELRRHGVRTK